MPKHNYSFQNFDKESMARAAGTDLTISTKQSIEICNYLRKRNLQKAKEILNNVIGMKQAIPFKRFKQMGHKRGMAAGRYPIKASKQILSLLESVEANAVSNGLNASNLVIHHMMAQKASQPMHTGRHRGRSMKRTHIEVVVEEPETKAEAGKGKGNEPKKEKATKENNKEKKQETNNKDIKKDEVKKQKPLENKAHTK